MEQAGSHRRRVHTVAAGRRIAVLIAAISVGLVTPAACGGGHSDTSTAGTRAQSCVEGGASASGPALQRTVSLGLETLINPNEDWAALRERLQAANVTGLELSAGRVEFTAFDWAAYPEAAADPGTDHIAQALDELGALPDGGRRSINISIDTFVPNWIKQDPSIAGRDADGHPSTYTPSASAIAGVVGDRYVEFAAAIARRYHPDQISFTELNLQDETFGEGDLQLYRRMTGATDWPRDPAGKIDEASPKIAAWRTQVIVDLLARTRAAIDQVEKGTSSKTQLGMDVLVNWVDPAAGRPEAGHDYCRLASVADRLTAWAYFASDGQQPADIEKLTAGLAASGVPIDRFVVSVGLWTEDQSSAQSITGKQLRQALAAAQTHGVTSVNVTPVSLMTPEDWSALEGAWG